MAAFAIASRALLWIPRTPNSVFQLSCPRGPSRAHVEPIPVPSRACERRDPCELLPCGAPSSSSLPSAAPRSFSSSSVNAVARP
eukprot:8201946-Pyramimonas_sp.AAC.1